MVKEHLITLQEPGGMHQSRLCSPRGLGMQGLAKDDGPGLGPEGVTQPPDGHPVKTPSCMVLRSSEYEENEWPENDE